jgi:hypothetical protein
MTEAGMDPGGILVIWNGITDEGEAEYYRWHDGEHIPERLSVPGYRRGRRFVHAERPREYLTVYETAGVDVFGSPPYLAQLARPTPWSQAVQRSFRDMVRRVFRVVACEGRGEGGVILVARVAVDPSRSAAFAEWAGQTLLPALAGTAGVVAVRALAHEPAATRRIGGQAHDGGPGASLLWLVLVECGDASVAGAVGGLGLGPDALARAGAVGGATLDVYRLQISMDA